MKAVLVIDMPDSCYECPCYDHSDYADGCMVFIRKTHDIDHGTQREKWCPLKPMPNKWYEDGSTSFAMGIARGFNKCLEEIEK